MAYQAGGTDYSGMLRQRAQADEGLTRALKAKGEREKEQRIADSKKRSGGQKLLSAVARGAAAYYTGGLSETMGGGQMIDKAMLGADAEENELGNLVGAGSAVYQAGMAQKASKLAQQDKRFGNLMDRREKNVQRLFDAGMDTEAMAAQGELDNMETNYLSSRKGLEAEKNPFSLSQKDYDIQPKFMSSGQKAAKVARLNKSEAEVAKEQAILGDQGRRQQGQTAMPQISTPDPTETPSVRPQPTRAPEGVTGFKGTGVPDAISSMPPPASAPSAPSQAERAQMLANINKKVSSQDVLDTGGPEAYNYSKSGRMDFSNDLLTEEQRKRAAAAGHYVGGRR